MSYQGKRPDQIEIAEKISAFAFIAVAVLLLIWSIFF
jgi:hypothetical protein